MGEADPRPQHQGELIAMAQGIKACLFDVFGTVVDWRSSVSRDLAGFAKEKSLKEIDWTEFAMEWRKLYQPSMEEVRSGRRAWTILDVLHRESLDKLVARYDLKGLSEADLDHMNRAWHRLQPWPDVVEGLTRLKKKFIIGTCSNGNIAQMVNMAKHAGLPWDCILSADLFGAYKPDPATYLGAARLLGIQPSELMMVAAHAGDLRAAREHGLRTAFVARPHEWGHGGTADTPPDTVDLAVTSFVELAERLGA
jgi:2-haloacid dehalogenase